MKSTRLENLQVLENRYDRFIDRIVKETRSWDYNNLDFIAGLAVSLVLAVNPDDLPGWDETDDDGPLNPDLRYVGNQLDKKFRLALGI